MSTLSIAWARAGALPLVLAVIASSSTACYVAAQADGSGNGSGGANSGTNSASGGGSGVTTDGLPCDIATLLQTRCAACHTGQTGIQIASYADLTGPSHTDPNTTMGAMAAKRMQDTQSPMPPATTTPATAAEISTFVAWVQSGMPKGTCGGLDAGPNPYNTPMQCSSNQTYAPSGEGSPNMDPGQACTSCHVSHGERGFSVAGTVYPTAHEPDNCIGGTLGTGSAVVIVTPASGPEVTLQVGATGNFHSYQSFSQPIHVRVRNSQGAERAMVAAPTSGDCNTCHTATGANGAPGRIMLP